MTASRAHANYESDDLDDDTVIWIIVDESIESMKRGCRQIVEGHRSGSERPTMNQQKTTDAD